MPYLIGIAGLLVIWVFYRIFSGKWSIMYLAKGEDGMPSSSQFQFLVWTIVIIFSYITIYVARAQVGEYRPIEEIPVNLLILMGISGFALIAAKGIIAHQLSNGAVSLKKQEYKGSPFKYLIGDDKGNPTLNKLQMIAWTLVAAVVYLFIVVKQVEGSALPVLPDVDESLLVLMGISQGTYLGKKLVTTTTPGLKKLTPDSTKAGQEVTVEGVNMGDEQHGSVVQVGKLFPSEIKDWSSSQLKFILPQEMKAGDYPVSVVIGGKESNKLTLSVNK